MAKICNLFSGSSGNCTYISSGGEAILVDAGMSCKQIVTALQERMLDIEEVKAIFITHAHNDHIKGLRVLLNKYNIPVYASRETLGYLIMENTFKSDCKYFDVETDPLFDLNMDVKFFRTSHDCEGSGGYTVTFQNGEKLALFTDLGYVSDELRCAMLGAKTVMIESNHDVGMLQNGMYPFATKQRILSDQGHLSNVSCAVELPSLIKNGATQIILAHLSRENNTPDLAEVTAKSVLMENGAKDGIDYSLYVAPSCGGKIIYI